MNNLSNLRKVLSSYSSKQKAISVAKYFKTGPGQYGEEDIFIGVSSPILHILAKKNSQLTILEIECLLNSKIHEERMLALFIMVLNYKKGNESNKNEIFNIYIKNIKSINNWDLVDCSAQYIIGPWLENKDKAYLYKLARSDSVWEKRIAIISTFYYIKNGQPNDSLMIAEILLHDDHYLIHKAVGWMLREIGNHCSLSLEETFLKKYYKNMPRTMLRYAIEKFPNDLRLKYLKGIM